MRFESRFFQKSRFTGDQVKKLLGNSLKDLEIARKVDILDVKFNYAYTSLIKTGITILGHLNVRVKSVPGHQVKIIDVLARVLDDKSIEIMGNLMRSKRNQDLYAGGIEITEKECLEYIEFVDRVFKKAQDMILKG